MRLIIVSGQSGAGKSIALRVLEDLGYYCVDNLPVSMLEAFISSEQKTKQNVACVGEWVHGSRAPRL